MNGTETAISQWSFDMTDTVVIRAEPVLPDYCPDLQALVGTQAAVRIKERRIEPGKITVEGVCIFTELFYSEGEGRLRSLIHGQEFSHSFPVDRIPSGFTVTARVQEASGRLLQARKMAVTASLILEVKGYENKIVISPVEQPSLFLKAEKVNGMRVCAANTRSFKLVEEMEIGEAEADIEEVLAADASVWVQETRMISEKAVLRGVAQVHLLYADENGACRHLEKEVPFNQIVELEGAEESCCVYASMDITSLKVSVSIEGEKAARSLAAALEIEAYARACRNVELTLVTDAYATDSQLNMEKMPLSVCGVAPIQTVETSVKAEAEPGREIIFAKADALISDAHIEQQRLVICGSVEAELIYRDVEGNYAIEKQITEFSVYPETANLGEEVRLDCEAVVQRVSFTESGYEVNVGVGVQLNEVRDVETVVSVEKNGEAPAPCECQAYLYYMNGEDSLWEVAKRYRTSPEAVRRANGPLENEGTHRVLFVPVLK